MALWQYLLTLGLIAATVGGTYAVFRVRHPASTGPAAPVASATRAAVPVAENPLATDTSAAGPGWGILWPALHDDPPGEEDSDDASRGWRATDRDLRWTVSEVVGDEASVVRRLRKEPATVVSVVLAEMTDGSVRVSRGTVDVAAGAVDGIVERIHTVTARSLMDAAWTPATAGWQVSDPGWFDGAASGIADADRALHAVLIGRTSAETAQQFGLHSQIADGVGDFTAVLVPLPFDDRVAQVVRAVRVVGLVFGAVTGHASIALACAKSLARTETTKRLRDALTTMTDPTRVRSTDRSGTADGLQRDADAPTAAAEVAGRQSAARETAAPEPGWTARSSPSDEEFWTALRTWERGRDDADARSDGLSRADADPWSGRTDPPSRDREFPWDGGAPRPW